jgi:peptide/nickel transport system ATP-binding protein
MAIMLITHNLGVVAEMCDDVVVMYLGRVVEQGPVDDIFHDPKHPVHEGAAAVDPEHRLDPEHKLPTISRLDPASVQSARGLAFHPRCASFIPGSPLRYRSNRLSLPVGERTKASCFLYP